LKLENESYKAGLTVPLTREHIEGFLKHENDEYYQSKLNELIASEVGRQEAILQKQKEDAERKAKEEEIRHIKENFGTPEQEQVNANWVKDLPHEQASLPSSPDKVVKVVVARFEVEVPVGIPDSKIVAKLDSMLKDAGITSCKSIEVV
jgi:hypothetical protein